MTTLVGSAFFSESLLVAGVAFGGQSKASCDFPLKVYASQALPGYDPGPFSTKLPEIHGDLNIPNAGSKS
jgi:hypothetical protein